MRSASRAAPSHTTRHSRDVKVQGFSGTELDSMKMRARVQRTDQPTQRHARCSMHMMLSRLDILNQRTR